MTTGKKEMKVSEAVKIIVTACDNEWEATLLGNKAKKTQEVIKELCSDYGKEFIDKVYRSMRTTYFTMKALECESEDVKDVIASLDSAITAMLVFFL